MKNLQDFATNALPSEQMNKLHGGVTHRITYRNLDGTMGTEYTEDAPGTIARIEAAGGIIITDVILE